MKLRWSNGTSCADEFDAGARATFEQALVDGLIAFRRHAGPDARAELHVEGKPGYWMKPIFPANPDEQPIKFAAGSLDSVNGVPTNGKPIALRMGHNTWVMNSRSRLSGGPSHEIVHPGGYHELPYPTCCGLYWADWVLHIGPGHWHADAVYLACLAALEWVNGLTGLAADVAEIVADKKQ
jgi:hypothetical protein